jgi:hypothetical protein
MCRGKHTQHAHSWRACLLLPPRARCRAALSGQAGACRLLLAAGADPNLRSCEWGTLKHATPAYAAMRSGCAEAVEAVLSAQGAVAPSYLDVLRVEVVRWAQEANQLHGGKLTASNLLPALGLVHRSIGFAAPVLRVLAKHGATQQTLRHLGAAKPFAGTGGAGREGGTRLEKMPEWHAVKEALDAREEWVGEVPAHVLQRRQAQPGRV